MIKYLAALISIMLGANGQYFLKLGVTRITQSSIGSKGLKEMAVGLISNFHLWIGLSSYVLSMVFWLYVLSQLELSKAYPLASLGYVITMLLGFFLLHEPINVYKIVGLALIVTGVIFINQG
ncbi:MAG: SMR family transporter [Bacteroidales bacterium]|nr:SMR family transporter [Bacteroidales bacterium]